MVKIGKMSKADLAQLTAQRAQDEFNIVQAVWRQEYGNQRTVIPVRFAGIEYGKKLNRNLRWMLN